MTEEFDFKSFKAEALKQMYAGKPLTGKDGVLSPLLENLLNAVLEGEMDAHMSAEERDAGNQRNGYGSKQVQSSLGELTVQTPRNRDSTFAAIHQEARAHLHLGDDTSQDALITDYLEMAFSIADDCRETTPTVASTPI